jgi:hypothetical protein
LGWRAQLQGFRTKFADPIKMASTEEVMNLRFDFLFVVTLAATAATAASGQDAGRAPAASGAQGARSIPDFSGIWSHPSFPGFEPPASGPGPVVNRSRRPQVNFDGRVLPPVNDILVSNPAQLVGDYANPILKPRAAEAMKRKGEMELAGIVGPTPTIQCWPEPVPYIFNGVAMQMLQQPDKIIFLYPNDHQVRYVRMNQPHAAQLTRSWYGDSVGHYEGDALVIDTIGVKIGPFAMVDFYGTPYTEALHVVERYRLLDYEDAREGLERDARENLRPARGADAGSAPDYSYRGKHLQLQFTVEDDGVFTKPWSATITYRRGRETWREVVCAENTQELALAGRNGAVPHADKPDF